MSRYRNTGYLLARAPEGIQRPFRAIKIWSVSLCCRWGRAMFVSWAALSPHLIICIVLVLTTHVSDLGVEYFVSVYITSTKRGHHQ